MENTVGNTTKYLVLKSFVEVLTLAFPYISSNPSFKEISFQDISLFDKKQTYSSNRFRIPITLKSTIHTEWDF